MNGKRAKSLRKLARTVTTNVSLQIALTEEAQRRQVRLDRRDRRYAQYPTASPTSVGKMVKKLYRKGVIKPKQ